MNAKKFSDAMSELDSKYINEVLHCKKKVKKPHWIKWGTMAACLCLTVAVGIMLTRNSNPAIPNPKIVHVPNPIITVTSIAEMEDYLDFDVPVLDKEIASYSVFVENKYPTMGQIDYADGSKFRI